MKELVIVKVFDSDKLVEVKQFDKSQIVFGHEAEVDFDLGSPEVSPIHALIEKRGEKYFLCDLGSQGGTLLNGRSVLDEVIEDSDVIQIGPYRLEFYIGAPKTKAVSAMTPPPPPPKASSKIYDFPQDEEENKDEKNNKNEEVAKSEPKVVESKKENSSEEQLSSSSRDKKNVTQSQPVEEKKIQIEKSVEEVDSPTQEEIKISEPLLAEVPAVSKKKPSKVMKVERDVPGTFAPESAYKNAKDFIKGEKGSVIEVLVVWQERVIESFHFSKKSTVQIGTSSNSDIIVPLGSGKKKQQFLKVDEGALLYLTPDMKGEVIRGGQPQSFTHLLKSSRMIKKGKYYQLDLQQGEMACVEIAPGGVFLYVRYTAEMPIPVLAQPLSMTPSEITGVVLSFILVGLLALYMSIYAPSQFIKDQDESQIRIAKFVYKAPDRPLPKLEKVEPKKEIKTIEKKKIVKKIDLKKKEKPKKKLVKIKVDGKKEPKKVLKKGKIAQVRANRTKRKRPKKFTSVKSGGGIKLGKKPGAGAKSRKKDVSKLGLFSAFGNKGTRAELNKSYSGAGGLLGLADKASGSSGTKETRPGQDIGTKLKETGAAGKGVAIQGISGVGTKGRSSGQTGYGQASLGGKNSVEIVPGGKEEEFVGSIDRAAVRRVVRAGLSAVRSCYERALNRRSSLSGKVIMQWTIVDHGRPTKAFVKMSTVKDKEMENCMKNRLLTWKFPEPPSGTYAEVTYPFVFNSPR